MPRLFKQKADIDVLVFRGRYLAPTEGQSQALGIITAIALAAWIAMRRFRFE
jgi:hypothetical protein